eukprot:GHRQ01026253.1.p2 GENE.GHRQ01026253.1~~GHRQ01026253.1.p2  ORF type:complete len:158 (+),score=54.84 GHRQ01026253.1:691-1164(+)
MATILDTMPKGAGGSSGLSREETVDRICEDLLSKTPVLFDKEDVRERLRKLAGGPTQPLTVHLRQELDRLNIVIKLTTTTLQNLRLAIAGTIALSGTLIESLDALFMARIPVEWLKKSWEVSNSSHPLHERQQFNEKQAPIVFYNRSVRSNFLSACV